MLWHRKCVSCVLAYFVTRKYTLKPKFTHCYVNQVFRVMHIKSNFVFFLSIKILKTLTAQSAKKKSTSFNITYDMYKTFDFTTHTAVSLSVLF
jgi:hypothetical protein